MLPQGAEIKHIETSLSQLSLQQQRELLKKLLQQRLEEESEFPLSAGQQGLWYAYRRDPSFTPFNVFLPTRIRSPLDVHALRRAIEFLVERHPCLRTTFSDSAAQLRQRVHARLPPEFIVEDAASWEMARIQERIQRESQRPFDLENGPLLRIRVYKLSSDDYVVLATTHHIVVDFWSLILLLRELQAAYPSFAAGNTPPLPTAPGNYAEFVREQEQLLQSPHRESLQKKWREILEGVPTVLELPSDFARPANFSGQANVVPLDFPDAIASRIVQFAAAHQATPFAVIHSGLQVLLARYSGQKSFLIGSPFSGRGHQKFEHTVGFFVNMLPMRADLEHDPTFSLLVSKFGQTLLDALEHQSYPFAQIVRDIAPTRDPSRSPMFQVSCTFEKAQDREESGRAGFLFPNKREVRNFGGLVQESFYVPQRTCHYDVEFIFELTDALRGMMVYARELFCEDSMRVFATNFQDLLASLLDQPRVPISKVAWRPAFRSDSVALRPDLTKKPPLAQPRIPACGYSTVQDWFNSIARHYPNQIALRDDDFSITYDELRQTSLSMAEQLVGLGAGPEKLVPVCGRRGARMLVGVLATLQSGAAFVPIDTQQPAIARDQLENDALPCAAIVDTNSADYVGQMRCPIIHVENAQCETRMLVEPRPTLVKFDSAVKSNFAQLAYVIYTSGSTGTPKGVMIEHQAICNTLAWRCQAVPLSNSDRVLVMLSHQFDACIGVCLTALTQGASLVWAESAARHDLDRLIDQIVRDQITILPAVPSLVRMLVNHTRFKQCGSLRQIWTGGEAMPSDLPGLLHKVSGAELWNFYGPTEAAVETTAFKVSNWDARRPIPIGREISNTTVYILDESLEQVPDTVPGQLAIVGPGLARGYLNHPGMTHQRFVVNRFDPTQQTRMYLTGDRGRRLPNGNIEFMGRMDQQVKLRGYRIELGEIEALLQSHPLVRSAAVKVSHAHSLAAQLVAFVTLHDPATAPQNLSQQMRAFLADRFPSYKVPVAVRGIDNLPMTTSGKIDRNRLPDIQADIDDDQLVQPNTPLEKFLAAAWQSTLGMDRVGVNQNFFDLGGSSLQAAMLTAQLTETLGLHVPTALLFDLADISQVAQRLVQLYETEMVERFGFESTTAYGSTESSSIPHHRLRRDTHDPFHPLLSPLKPTGSLAPIFLVHPPGGIVVCYRDLAKHLPADQPLMGIRSRGLHGRERLPSTLEEMASEYVAAVRTRQARGPYVLGGWSLGGIIAFEMAQQLYQQGEVVQRLLLLDSTISKGSTDLVPDDEQVNAGLEYGIELTLDELSQLDASEQLPFLWQHARNLGVLDNETPEAVVKQVLDDLQTLFHHHVALTCEYRIQKYPGKIVLFRPSDTPFVVQVSEDRGWRNIADAVQVHFVPGHHHSMVQPPQVAELARLMAYST